MTETLIAGYSDRTTLSSAFTVDSRMACADGLTRRGTNVFQKFGSYNKTDIFKTYPEFGRVALALGGEREQSKGYIFVVGTTAIHTFLLFRLFRYIRKDSLYGIIIDMDKMIEKYKVRPFNAFILSHYLHSEVLYKGSRDEHARYYNYNASRDAYPWFRNPSKLAIPFLNIKAFDEHVFNKATLKLNHFKTSQQDSNKDYAEIYYSNSCKFVQPSSSKSDSKFSYYITLSSENSKLLKKRQVLLFKYLKQGDYSKACRFLTRLRRIYS